MLKGKHYGRILKTGTLAGAVYGAELNYFTQAEVTEMTTAVFASERVDVPEVPNYIKEIVIGTECCPASVAILAQALSVMAVCYGRPSRAHGVASP